MENRKSIAILSMAIGIVLVLAINSAAVAQGKPGRQATPPNQVGRPGNGVRGGNQNDKSDVLMKQAAKLCTEAHKSLKQALPIYDGHRHMAMELDKLTIQDIRMGLRWDRQHGNAPTPSAQQQMAGIKPEQEQNPSRYSQAQIQASNQKMIEAGQLLEKAKALLQSADHDYGGYRAQAVQLTDAAMSEIKRGLAWISNHGG